MGILATMRYKGVFAVKCAPEAVFAWDYFLKKACKACV